MSIETKQLHALSKIYKEAVYGGAKKEAPKDTRMVVTNADKKANTKAYQNMKAGVKGYKAADHMGEEKKAAKDYDGDGKVESGKEEYFGSKDKAIKKAMGKKIKEGVSNWRHDLKEIPNYDQIPETSKDRNKKIEEKKVKNSVKINPNMEEGYGDKKKKKKHDCASKVKHEQFGVGNCISEAHDLDENGNVAHYDVEFEEYIVEGVPVEHLEILVTEMHEHVIPEGKGEKNCGCGKNPCITYGKKGKVEEAKAKYDNTKSPDYEKKRKALAKKHGGEENIKGHPQYENRMASHTAGMSDAQKDMASSQVSKGFAYKHGRRLDKANFGDRKKAGKRGNPPSYRKSADSPEMELRYPYGKSNIRQGKGSFKGLKKEELLKSLRGFMGEGKIADAMRANLEKMKASDA